MTALGIAGSDTGEHRSAAAAQAGVAAGFVTALATTPVKGLRLSANRELTLDRTGVHGNRAFYLIDDRSRMVNGKLVGVLTAICADYDAARDRLLLTFPDGTAVAGTVSLGGSVETRFFSRRPTARLVIGPWSDALSEFAGRRLRLVKADAVRGGVDRGPAGAVSLISTASVAHLEGLADGRAVDPRRFRMLIEADGPVAHAEDGWVGREVRIGGAVVAMRGHVGRCLVTTQSPETGVVDLPTLDLLSYRRGLPTTEPLAFGIYGEVVEPGSVTLGDPVVVI
jgi:MOSC domain-containing protein